MKYLKQPGDEIGLLVGVAMWTLSSVLSSLEGDWSEVVAWLCGSGAIVLLQWHCNIARKTIDSLMELIRNRAER